MCKRGENIFKRIDGRFEGRYVQKRDENNKIIKYGFVYGKNYLETKLKKELALKKCNINDKLKKEFFCESIDLWLATKKDIKSSTRYNYYCIIKSSIKPYFNQKKLIEITDSKISAFTNYLYSKNLSPKRIRDILLILKQFFRHKKILINIEFPKVKKKKMEILTNLESLKIQKCLSKNDLKDFGIIIALYTGMRIGELCALKWSDINIDEQELYVEKTIARINSNDLLKLKNFEKMEIKGRTKTKVILDTPKTEMSIRTIPIHKRILPQLKKLKEKYDSDAYILTGTKSFMNYNSYYIFYKAKLKKLGIKNYTFHALRHTFASRALASGMDIKSLSEILGHSSVKITLDRYVHVNSQEKILQMNKLHISRLNRSKK